MKDKKFLLTIFFLFALFLRLYRLDRFPPGLYSDEAALGYNAYSILKTGRDEYGRLFPLSFRSFGDYKPPLSSWAMIPAIALFGLNELSVRLPFALAGSLTVVLVYLIAERLFKDDLVALTSALLLTISPWHLYQTRCAMLVGLEAFFITAGFFFFIKAVQNTKKWLNLSAVCFVAAIYTYYGSRVTVPLLVGWLAFVFRKRVFQNGRRAWLQAALLGFLLLVPLLVAIAKDPNTITGRVRFVSVFYDQNITGQLWRAHTLDGPNYPVWLSRFFHNKPVYYLKDIVRRYLQHFSFRFLVLKGDTHPPFQIPNMGPVYLLDWLFAFYGAFLLFQRRNQLKLALLGWLAISPFVASLTFLTPAANRSFNLVVPLTLTAAYGLVHFVRRLRFSPNLVCGLLLGGYLLSFAFFLHQYYRRLPLTLPDKWHFGRRQLVAALEKYEGDYPQVILSNKGGPPYIFLLFYKRYPPQRYWQTQHINPVINELGWMHVDGFDKYEIPRDFQWEKVPKKVDTLYVGYEEEIPDDWTGQTENSQPVKVEVLEKVWYPNGRVVHKIVTLKPQEE